VFRGARAETRFHPHACMGATDSWLPVSVSGAGMLVLLAHAGRLRRAHGARGTLAEDLVADDGLATGLVGQCPTWRFSGRELREPTCRSPGWAVHPRGGSAVRLSAWAVARARPSTHGFGQAGV
jgi:hypothetical protein